ncbi:glycosyltransferase [Candidatus Agathobaculum pullicola]|uniref:glycosyltransferase n=1 Tax=Candidatus Agathobaculum pullicola TaxID=2838426 RepID=UPI003F925BE7
MSEIYNEEYYHSGCGPIPYEESEHWNKFFGMIAERIVSDLHPKRVLDAGCAMGYLVAALRDRGVEAYGLDISEYAISMVRDDIKPYCMVGTLTEKIPEELPKHFDLVVTIEVLEHLYAEDGQKAIANLCTLADTVLFSSTPDDFEERTHINVQQREYWARLFFEQGFVDDINYRPRYLTYHASLFRRSNNISRLVQDYERNIRMTEHEHIKSIAEWKKVVDDKETHIRNIEAHLHNSELAINEMTDLLRIEREEAAAKLAEEQGRLQREQEKFQKEREKARKELEQTKGELDHYMQHYHAAIGQREDLKMQLAEMQAAYNVISNAFFWKITKPFRVIVDLIKCPLRKIRFFRIVNKGVRCYKENGFRYTWRKVKNKIHHRQEYAETARKSLFTKAELEAQRQEKFPKDIKFSIVVPLFNTPEKFLREMIQSVIDQTYQNWELCMADGSDVKHGSVEKICRQYMKKDARIKFRKLEKNLGISENTNACLEMASGEYIGLFDHDDLLHPAALHEVMHAICEQNGDFIYTDENTFHEQPKDAFCPHFKPDYAPDTLRSYNYICHFSVFSKNLLDEVGWFRSEFDGSQDYDLILRLTEEAKRIVHIPEILYYWRAHSGSVAENVSEKPYTLDAAKKALAEHLERCHLRGHVEDSVIPSTYKIVYEIHSSPLVSIIIPNKDHIDELKKCIDSISNKTSYDNYEIIVVENNSTETQTFQYYQEVQKDKRIKIVNWEGIFNYSAINNYGVQKAASGEYVLLLNNDIEVITPDWIQEMLMFAQRKDVGAVGTMLYYPDNTVQHAGVILGIGGVGGHSHKYRGRGDYGYMSRMTIAQNLSAVTAACMMIPRHVWDKVDGLDESFAVAFNDVDLCMRIRKAGYLIVWTPYAELYHYESKSRGLEDTPEKKKRFEGEVLRFQNRWKKELAAGDPYYNPNLTLDREDFTING